MLGALFDCRKITVSLDNGLLIIVETKIMQEEKAQNIEILQK